MDDKINDCCKSNSTSSLLVSKPKVKEATEIKKIRKLPAEQVWFAS